MRSHDTTLSSEDEQILVDHERRFSELEDRIEDVLHRACSGWTSTEFLLLACEALQWVDGIPNEAFDAIESAARRAKEAELPEHLRGL